jgi:hypothetical protein
MFFRAAKWRIHPATQTPKSFKEIIFPNNPKAWDIVIWGTLRRVKFLIGHHTPWFISGV